MCILGFAGIMAEREGGRPWVGRPSWLFGRTSQLHKISEATKAEEVQGTLGRVYGNGWRKTIRAVTVLETPGV